MNWGCHESRLEATDTIDILLCCGGGKEGILFLRLAGVDGFGDVDAASGGEEALDW